MLVDAVKGFVWKGDVAHVAGPQVQLDAPFLAEAPCPVKLSIGGVDSPRFEAVLLKEGERGNWPSGSAVQDLEPPGWLAVRVVGIDQA